MCNCVRCLWLMLIIWACSGCAAGERHARCDGSGASGLRWADAHHQCMACRGAAVAKEHIQYLRMLAALSDAVIEARPWLKKKPNRILAAHLFLKKSYKCHHSSDVAAGGY
jgi:hypothetical protein